MSAAVDDLCARLDAAREALAGEGPEAAARALQGLDQLIEAAVAASPTPGHLAQVRAALAALEQLAAEASEALRKTLLQGGAGARAERAYRR